MQSTSIKGKKIGILAISYDEISQIILEASTHKNLTNVNWYGSSGIAKVEEITKNAKLAEFVIKTNMHCPTFGLDDYSKPKRAELKQKLQESLGHEANIYAYTAYDSLWLATLTNLSSTDNKTFIKTLPQIANNYFGMSGWTKLNEFGDRKHGNYDYWTIIKQDQKYIWNRSSRYISNFDNSQK